MLIKIDGLKSKTKTKLPKLKTEKGTSTVRKRRAVDDSIQVANKMEALFSNYDWTVITTEAQLKSWLEGLGEIGLDTETTGLDIFKSSLAGIGLGTEKKCAYIPLYHEKGVNYQGDIEKIESYLKDRKIYGFNAKFDMKVLKHYEGIEYKTYWCGYLGARLHNSAEPANGLKELYRKYIDPEEDSYTFSQLFSNPFTFYDPAIVGAYGAVDAMKHIRLGKWQEQVLDKEAMKLMKNLEMPLAHILVDVELRGIELDLEWCNELVRMLEADMNEIKAKIETDYPGLNPSSPKQVAEWLYDKLKFPQIGGRKTGEDILKQFDHPLPKLVLEYRKVQKLLSTYAKKMPADADDGVIHATFNQYGADTGRFSSSDPNLQNIPRDNRFRNMFKAREGHKLVSCDYSQQEVYILASLANDKLMIEAYEKGYDFYSYMASIVFEQPYEDCLKTGKSAELRDQMKSVVLGLNYDMGIKALANDIGKTIPETKEIYRKFFERCPRVREFRNERLAFATKHGYVETVLGRKRRLSSLHLPDFSSTDKAVEQTLNSLKNEYGISRLLSDAKKAGIEVIDRRTQKTYETRQVVNSAVQGSASDMTKLAIVVASRDPKLKELGCQILMQIHDEIVAEFPENNAERGGERLSEIMIDVGYDLIGLKMQAVPKVMSSWGE